ncbi:chorismate synthase, partial [Chlamydia psittaci C19/98]
GPGGASIQ